VPPDHAVPAVLGDQPRHYGRLGLARDQTAVWEDGMRTDGSKNTFEWWYFDLELDDGSKLVISFFTKPFSTCYVTTEKEYGYTPLPVFMLARAEAVLADDPRSVQFQRRDVYTDDFTGKAVGNVEKKTP
jgi:hypothetical protein